MAVSVSYNCDISAMNTFGMKVRAAAVAEYDSVADLRALFEDGAYGALPRPFFCIGGGSNLLFAGDFPGTLLRSRIASFELSEGPGPQEVTVRAGSGLDWEEFCSRCAEEGIWGPENLSLIPGYAGSAAVQNIGAYGVEAGDIIRKVEAYDTSLRQMCMFDVSECGYGYRDSFFKNEGKGRYIITSVIFGLTRGYSPRLGYKGVSEALPASDISAGTLTPMQVRQAVIRIRRGKLPDVKETGSAGSFFRNPCVGRPVYDAVCASVAGPVPHYDLPDGTVKIPAAWLIDTCGLRGLSSGGAQVYDRQPLVIVNASGNATPDDILALKDKVIEAVTVRFGITLVPEVEIVHIQ